MSDEGATLERRHRIVFEDGTSREFRAVHFGPHSLVADGRVYLYSQVDEVHLARKAATR